MVSEIVENKTDWDGREQYERLISCGRHNLEFLIAKITTAKRNTFLTLEFAIKPGIACSGQATTPQCPVSCYTSSKKPAQTISPQNSLCRKYVETANHHFLTTCSKSRCAFSFLHKDLVLDVRIKPSQSRVASHRYCRDVEKEKPYKAALPWQRQSKRFTPSSRTMRLSTNCSRVTWPTSSLYAVLLCSNQ